MADCHHTPNADTQSDENHDSQLADYRAVPPVIPVSVVEEEGDFR